MKATVAFAAAILLCSGCSNTQEIDPATWSCESLVEPVIEMSQEREVQILEITGVSEFAQSYPSYIECRGRAEWSQGTGLIEFGAKVTDGGNVIIKYRQM